MLVTRTFAALFTLALAGLGLGQTFQEYLKLRKQAGITQAVGIPSLETFVGKRTLEVQGTVKGTFSAGGRSVILVERTDGEPLHIQTDRPPDWLSGNEVEARLLIRAERDSELSEMRAWLIGAASEAEVAAIEAAARRKAEEAARKAKLVKAPPKPKNVSGKSWSLPASEVTPIYASFIKGRNPRLTDYEAYKIAAGIVGFSIQYGVDARLIMAMVMCESGFNPGAVSRAGAMGLGQLMPGTAKGMGVTNAYDSMQNLYATVRLVRGHLERYSKKTESDFEALVYALAAYNSGSGTVRRFNGPPPYRETQSYIRKVVATYQAFCGVRN